MRGVTKQQTTSERHLKISVSDCWDRTLTTIRQQYIQCDGYSQYSIHTDADACKYKMKIEM